MDFRILGPLEARDGDRALRLRGGKQRALLALLLVNANRTLAVDRIVDELWAEDVPETAQKMVQIYVSRLRKVLPAGVLHTRPPGYALVLDPNQLDLHRFEALLDQAQLALEAGRAEHASAGFREALELWRGPALAEFDSEPFAIMEAARVEELRVSALEGRVEADLQLGRHAGLVGELEALIARYPLREGLRRQHMLALYRSGRQAEALAAYQEARHVLAVDLGIEPSPALRDLERRILRQDSSLDPAAPAPETAPAPPTPARTTFRATGPVPDEMLKLVTILFADIVGSTALTESRHPEDVRALMADYFAVMSAEIDAEGGTIEKFVGDAIMAVFGVPTVHEDDAARAVRAALRMLERLRGWNEQRDPHAALEIRIGISTGDVLASGATGSDLHVTGDAVNLAARLQQTAEPGTIVVADRTARAVRSQFELRPIDEPPALKGKSQPTPAWTVEGDRRTRDSGITTPLVGREHELAVLRTTFDRVRVEGRPSLVTVVGDAGVGKSRLVREFLSPLEREVKVLTGRCLANGHGDALWPLGEILKTEAGVLETDRSSDASTKIAALVESTVDRDFVPDRSRTAAVLASTLGLRTPDDPLAALDPRELYAELVGAWRVLLASTARRGPVVVLIEDLHWADPTMLDVLDELAERLEGALLFIGTARPELLRSRPDWGGGRRSFSSLPLDPLSHGEGARLVSLLPGVETLAEPVRRLILERCGGNPFFLEEIVRHLSSEGTERVEIPDNVQAVILARLDLLTPDERRVAQRAAVVGHVFWDGALARLAPIADLDEALQTLRRGEFVLERVSSTIAGQREYAFKHALIRDVAYASMLRTERGQAHADTAAWIEETSGERTGELAELLAHHYDVAFSFVGDDALRLRARKHLRTAAAGAHRRFAIHQGERLARRAVELSNGSAERAEALEALGDLHYLSFLGDAAWETYVDALAELAESDPAYARVAGKATLFATRFLGTTSELPPIDDVRGILEQALAVAPANSRDRTLLLVNRGFLHVQREDRRDAETEAALREARRAAEELGDADLISAAFDLAATYEEHRGRYGAAYRIDLERKQLVDRMNDVKEIGDAYSVAARCAQHLGRFREAEAHATACIDRARGIDAGSYLHGLTWRVAARFSLGDWDAALADQAELERVAALSPRELPPAFAMGAYARTGLCHELRGEHGDADRYNAIAIRYAEQARYEPAMRSIHLGPAALALARRGSLDEALDLTRFVPASLSAAVVLEAACEIATVSERWDEAARLVASAREEAEVGEHLALPLVADRLEGIAASVAGDLAEAVRLLERSAQGFTALDAAWEEAWSRLLLAEIIVDSDAPRAQQELAHALPVFERLRSVRELHRAQALLAAVAV